MKNIFYICLFLLLTVCAQAQRSVTYVSFFPPRDVAHNEVTLTQVKEESFRIDDIHSQEERLNYAELPGGLILGAADNAVIDISTITIVTKEVKVPYTIRELQVDNNIYVRARGQIKNINIGAPHDDNCDGDYSCNEVYISSYRMSWPLSNISFVGQNTAVNIRSFGKTSLPIGKLKIANADYSSYASFLPTKVPANDSMTSAATRDMATTDTLEWRNLRINGTEKCIKYLTLNPPSPNLVMEGGECQEPPSTAPVHPGVCQS